MTKDYKTIRVPADDYDVAKASKHDSETWGEFIRRCTDTPPETQELVPVEDALAELRASPSGEIDADALAEKVASRTSDAVVSELEGRQR